MIALLNLSVLGFSFVVFHDKAKRTQQGDLLVNTSPNTPSDNLLPGMTPGDLDGTERRQQLGSLPPHVPKVRGPFQPGQLSQERKFERNRDFYKTAKGYRRKWL